MGRTMARTTIRRVGILLSLDGCVRRGDDVCTGERRRKGEQMNPYSGMTTAQIHKHVEANRTEDEGDASYALMRLAEIATDEGCAALVALSLRILAEMPGFVSGNYAVDIHAAAEIEEIDTTREILFCAADILRTNEE